MAQRDTVVRWIEQLGQLVRKLLGTGDGADLALARQEVDAAVQALLGGMAAVVPRMTPASAAAIVNDPDRLFAYAQLLSLDAMLLAAEGKPEPSRATRARALAFGEEAARRSPMPRPDWQEWIAAHREALDT